MCERDETLIESKKKIYQEKEGSAKIHSETGERKNRKKKESLNRKSKKKIKVKNNVALEKTDFSLEERTELVSNKDNDRSSLFSNELYNLSQSREEIKNVSCEINELI